MPDNYEGENNLESKLAYFGGFEIKQSRCNAGTEYAHSGRWLYL
jgi:hypothetical protein